MIKKEVVQRMLEWLGNVYEKRIDDKLVSSYYFRLKPYDEDKIKKVVFKWADTQTAFPKIADIIGQLPKFDEDANYRIESHRMCNVCHKADVMCIKEPADSGTWQCRSCYTGFNDAQIREKMINIGRMMNGKERDHGDAGRLEDHAREGV